MTDEKEDKVRQKQVPLYMDMIRDDLERIETSTDILRDNLIEVVKDDLLSEDSKKVKDVEALVPLACSLRDFHLRAKIILSTINYINESLEL